MRISFQITKQIVLSSRNIPFQVVRANCQDANCKVQKTGSEKRMCAAAEITETQTVQKSISRSTNMAFKSYWNFICSLHVQIELCSSSHFQCTAQFALKTITTRMLHNSHCTVIDAKMVLLRCYTYLFRIIHGISRNW